MKKLLSIVIIIALVFSQGVMNVYATEDNSDTTAVATPAVTAAENKDNVFQSKTFDPSFPPIYDQKVPDGDVPAGWEQHAVINPETNETLYWTLKKIVARTSGRTSSPASYSTDVLINLSTIQAGSMGFTYTNNVVTLTDSSITYIIDGTTTVNRIEVDSYATANIALNGASITTAAAPIVLKNGATARIILPNGTVNTLTCTGTESGIFVPANTKLIIESTGSTAGTLTVKANGNGAGIGTYASTGTGINTVPAGDITINSGNVNVTAAYGGAGIGSGGLPIVNANSGNGGNITINGGIVTITANYGAGIGSGGGWLASAANQGATTQYTGNGGSVTINDGSVKITTVYGAGIGSGGGGSAYSNSANYLYAGEGGNITINGGTVSITSTSGAGIGSGYGYKESNNGGNIAINGGTVESKSTSGAGIGGGTGTGGVGGNVVITGGNVTATSDSGAGIGCGNSGTIGDATLSVSNANVQAFSKSKSAIMVSNEYNSGSSYIVNGLITNVTSTVAANFKAFNSTNLSDTLTFTLPASYQGFAFTGSYATYKIETTNLTPQQKILVNQSDIYNKYNVNTECDKRIMYSGAGVLLSATLTSDIPAGGGSSPGDVAVTGVTVSPKVRVIEAGSTAQLTASVQPLSATNKGVKWQSSNPNIVSVDSNGVVTANASGFVAIMVTTDDGGYYDFANILVPGNVTGTDTGTGTGSDTGTPPTNPAVNATGITISDTSLTLNINDIHTLTAQVTPSDTGNQDVTWESTDPTIVSVDANGEIKALRAGSAVITAKSVDGGYSATCNVTANDPNKNLAENASQTASTYAGAASNADKAFDGNTATGWKVSVTSAPNQYLIIDFGTLTQFDEIVIEEIDLLSKIYAYEIQYNDGTGWRVFDSGSVLGASYSHKSPVKLEAIQIKFVIKGVKSNATGNVGIREFGVYNR